MNTYFWEYDFGADSWSLSSWSLTPRVYPVYAQVNEKVFVYGGEDSQGSFMNTFEAMDLGTNQLLDLGNFTSDARRGSMAVVSDDAFYWVLIWGHTQSYKSVHSTGLLTG